MRHENRNLALQSLRLIAAEADKLASDLDNGRLWEGEYGEAVSRLRKHVAELPSERG